MYFAPVVRFVFLPFCSVYMGSCIQMKAKFILKSINIFISVREKVFISFCIENFKIILFSVHTGSTWSTQQYLHYCTLVVICSML